MAIVMFLSQLMEAKMDLKNQTDDRINSWMVVIVIGLVLVVMAVLLLGFFYST